MVDASKSTGSTGSTSSVGGHGAFAPGFSAKFAPGLGININVNKGGGADQAAGAAANPGSGLQRSSGLVLPEPAFYSSADIKAYCEGLRSFAAYAAIEVEVGAEILKAALEQAGKSNPIARRMDARSVARKIAKASDALADAAALGVGGWMEYQRVYAEAISPTQVRQQPRPFQF